MEDRAQRDEGRRFMLARIDERVCLEARRHGVVLARPLLRALVARRCRASHCSCWPGRLRSCSARCCSRSPRSRAVRNVWRWERTRLVMTTEKLFVVHGTVRRRAAAVRLARVESLELEQGLLGRLLGYGTLVAGPLEVSHVAKPRQVFRLARAALRLAPRPEAPCPGTVPGHGRWPSEVA